MPWLFLFSCSDRPDGWSSGICIPVHGGLADNQWHVQPSLVGMYTLTLAGNNLQFFQSVLRHCLRSLNDAHNDKESEKQRPCLSF